MLNMTQRIGHAVIYLASFIGQIFIFGLLAVTGMFRRPFYTKNIMHQIMEIGYFSLPVVGLTSIFTGAVLALQSYAGFTRFSAEGAIATVVVLSITRELAPVLTGLMVAGRVGASIAAEIGTMKVTEQIDALSTLSTDPIKYLVTPRLIASIIVMPLLVMISDIIGIMGGYLVATKTLGFNQVVYLQNTAKYLESMDIILGLVKALTFGIIIALVSCFSGYNSSKGAQGVGMATTNAVVLSSIMILLSNYVITKLFL